MSGWAVWLSILALFASGALSARLAYPSEQAARAMFGATFGTLFAVMIVSFLRSRRRERK